MEITVTDGGNFDIENISLIVSNKQYTPKKAKAVVIIKSISVNIKTPLLPMVCKKDVF